MSGDTFKNFGSQNLLRAEVVEAFIIFKILAAVIFFIIKFSQFFYCILFCFYRIFSIFPICDKLTLLLNSKIDKKLTSVSFETFAYKTVCV